MAKQKPVWERFGRLVDHVAISHRSLAKTFDVSSQSVGNWTKDPATEGSTPDMVQRVKIAIWSGAYLTPPRENCIHAREWAPDEEPAELVKRFPELKPYDLPRAR